MDFTSDVLSLPIAISLRLGPVDGLSPRGISQGLTVFRGESRKEVGVANGEIFSGSAVFKVVLDESDGAGATILRGTCATYQLTLRNVSVRRKVRSHTSGPGRKDIRPPTRSIDGPASSATPPVTSSSE